MFDWIRNKSGQKIFAAIDHPKDNGPFPAVLIVHGFKGFSAQRHIRVISDALVDKGFLTLRPDLTKNPGQGYLEFADMTYTQELSDCNDCLDYLLSLDEVDSTRVGIAGHSIAGMIASEIASKRAEIKALAILSGVFGFEFIAEHIFSKPYEKAKKEFTQKGWTNVWSETLEKRLKIKRAFYEDIIKRTAADFAKKIKCPTLVISSGRDEAVAQIHADNWIKYLGSANKKMEIIKDSDHNYSGEALDKVTDVVSEWFLQALSI